MQSKIKVLIADDVAAMRSILRNVLRDYGYEDIEGVPSGEEALRKLLSQKFHMAMLDINMPVIDGIQVLKEIREIDPHIFVVMVTADGSAETLKTTLALGVNGYVVKPYSSIKIKGVIQKFNEHLVKLGLTPATPLEGKS